MSTYTTPIGIVNYPHLAEKDTRGDAPSNKYKVEMFFTSEQLKEGPGKKLVDAVKTTIGEAKKAGKPCKRTPFFEVDSEEQGKLPDELYGKGYVRIRASTGFDDIRDNNLIVDSVRDPMSTEQIISKIVSGSKGRAIVKPIYYQQQGGGVSLALLSYQYCGKGDFEVKTGINLNAAYDDLEIPDGPMENGKDSVFE
jgi:hypothetical protein